MREGSSLCPHVGLVSFLRYPAGCYYRCSVLLMEVGLCWLVLQMVAEEWGVGLHMLHQQ